MTNQGGFILESIWRDNDFRALPRTAQATYAQLLSQKELDRAGLLPYQPTKWVKGCDEMDLAALAADLKALEVARFIVVDEDTDEVFVRSYMRNANVVKQPNLLKNAIKCARLAASGHIRAALADELRRIDKLDCAATADEIDPRDTPASSYAVNPSRTLSEPIANPSGRVKPFGNPSRTPREPRGEGEGEGEGSAFVDGDLGGRAHTHAHARTREATPPHPEPITRGSLALVPDHAPDADPEPASRCPRHRTRIGRIDEPCAPCRDARLAHEAWTDRTTAAALAERLAATTARRTAINACTRCDEFGWQLDHTGQPTDPARRCTHEE
ncbi:hypothetical protein SEA_TARDUS_58 [Gordonia phage Tardus]|uniref:Helix-turn-helix DNA binding domain protein n=1 Tax=Gordonia phage Tardus TaxID=2939734 RepID=A0A9E7J748_9CAUD|nr:hypothetical protein SEA_TARDUS_58 [Gordonia phage Tardus]